MASLLDSIFYGSNFQLGLTAFAWHRLALRVNKLNNCQKRMDAQVARKEKCPAKQKLRMKMCRKGHKRRKKCVKISKVRLKRLCLQFCVLKPEFCAGCGNFVQTCVCVSAAFKNNATAISPCQAYHLYNNVKECLYLDHRKNVRCLYQWPSVPVRQAISVMSTVLAECSQGGVTSGYCLTLVPSNLSLPDIGTNQPFFASHWYQPTFLCLTLVPTNLSLPNISNSQPFFGSQLYQTTFICLKFVPTNLSLLHICSK